MASTGGYEDLGDRLKRYALRIVRLFTSLPKSPEAQLIGRQFLKSGTSGGAHHREAKRARSRAEFVSKMGGGLQELEETAYWLETVALCAVVRVARGVIAAHRNR